jgi:hypothetical protein
MKHFLLFLLLVVFGNFQSAYAQCNITAEAGPSLVVCGDSSIMINGSVAGADGGVWSTDGTGQFLDMYSLNTYYYPSGQDESNGMVVLTLTTTGNGDCDAIQSSITITFTPSPTANAGTDQLVCAGNNVALSGNVTIASGGNWATNGGGFFTPNASSLNASYVPSASDEANGTVVLTLTTTGNGTCNPVSSNVTITFTPSPTANAGTDQLVCAGNNVALSGSVAIASGGNWATNGGGFFTPNASSLNASYVPSASDEANGTVVLTLTTTGNGTCNPVSSNVTITFTPSPTANAGTDQLVCAGNNVALSGSVTIASGGNWSTNGAGFFTPNASSLNVSYVPSASDQVSGTVVLTLTTTGNGTCASASSTTTITITPIPTADAGPNLSMVASGVTLNGVVTGASGSVWSTSGSGMFNNTNILNAVYTPSAADLSKGFVTLTLTTTGNGSCSPATDNVVLTSNAEICNVSIATTIVDNKVTFRASNDDGTSVGSYYWSFGDGFYSGEKTQTHIYASAGTYDVTLFYSTPDSSCTASKGTVLTIANVPIQTYSISGVIKAGANNLDLGKALLFKLNDNNNYDLVRTFVISTAENGLYNFGNLENGTYLVGSIIEKTSVYFNGYIEAYFGDVQSWTNATTIVVSNSNAPSRNINLIAYVSPDVTWNTGSDTIQGVLTFDASVNLRIAGTPTANPAANALVRLYNSDNVLLTSTYTDAFGNYSFGNLIAGNYIITVEYAGGGAPSDLIVNVDGDPSTKTIANSVILKEDIVSSVSEAILQVQVLSMKIYPNPAIDNLYVELPSDIKGASALCIYSSIGKLVYMESHAASEDNHLVLDVNFLSPGLYIVEVMSEGKLLKSKFAKK